MDEAGQLVFLAQAPQLTEDVLIYRPTSHQRQHLPGHHKHLQTGNMPLASHAAKLSVGRRLNVRLTFTAGHHQYLV